MSYSQQIIDEATSWPGVTAQQGDDVREVIALLRLNYDRIASG